MWAVGEASLQSQIRNKIPSELNNDRHSPSYPSLRSLSAALAGLVAKAAPSIVAVRSHRSQSSGFAWRPGLVVTADEALSEEGEFAVTVPGGDSAPAQLVGRDPTTDVALLRIGLGRR